MMSGCSLQSILRRSSLPRQRLPIAALYSFTKSGNMQWRRLVSRGDNIAQRFEPINSSFVACMLHTAGVGMREISSQLPWNSMITS